jgi:hypothetical protein
MTDSKRPRRSKLAWVRLGDLHVSARAQRAFKEQHAAEIAAKFDLEALGFPVVSKRGGGYWVVDGQHRVAALRMVGFSENDRIQVECYEGLTEAEEADLFLTRDERKKIGTLDRFRIGVVAGRDEDEDIDRIVQSLGFRVEHAKREGSIGAVAALRFAYQLDPEVLRRCVRILGESFDGDPQAFTSELIKGTALVCQRYNGSLDDDKAVTKLATVTGGPVTVKRKAASLRLRTGHSLAYCTAGAIVETLNTGRGGRKLDPWWS